MGHVPLCRSISEGRTAFCLACSTPDWGRADRSEGGLQHRWLRRSRFSALAPRQSRDGSVGRLHTVERGVFDPSVEYRLHRVPVSLQSHYGQTPVTHRLHAVLRPHDPLRCWSRQQGLVRGVGPAFVGLGNDGTTTSRQSDKCDGELWRESEISGPVSSLGTGIGLNGRPTNHDGRCQIANNPSRIVNVTVRIG
jgi:hypothetical protein